MKITINFPDTTQLAFIGYVFTAEQGLSMTMSALDSNDLVNGNEVTIPKKENADEIHN